MTKRVQLGGVACSGDKGADTNVGIWTTSARPAAAPTPRARPTAEACCSWKSRCSTTSNNETLER
jgi:hypothetical protein